MTQTARSALRQKVPFQNVSSLAVHEVFSRPTWISLKCSEFWKDPFSYSNIPFWQNITLWSHYHATSTQCSSYINEPYKWIVWTPPCPLSAPFWSTEHHPIMFLPHLEDGCLTASPSPVGWSEFHDFRKLPWKTEKKRWMILGNHGDLYEFSGKPSTLEMQSCSSKNCDITGSRVGSCLIRSYHASDSSSNMFKICCLEVSGYMAAGFCSSLSSHTMKNSWTRIQALSLQVPLKDIGTNRLS